MTFNNEFDRVLHDALAEYREAEPLAGLEDRILQRSRLQTERRWNLWWRRSAIIAAAAALVIAAWIGAVHRLRQDVAVSSVVQKQASVELPSPKTAVTEVPERPTSRHAPLPVSATLSRSKPAPVREHFPSPVPLKPEEQMLLALARTHPEILMDKSGDNQEIVIDPIKIKSLVDETAGSQGEN